MNVESINENNSITNAIAREMSGGLTSQYEQVDIFTLSFSYLTQCILFLNGDNFVLTFQDIQKLELYVPLLENLIQHVEVIGDHTKVIRWTSDLKIRWTSPLSSSSFFNLMGPRFFQIDKLQFELGMVLFFYGAMLREWASHVLKTGRT